MNHKMKYPKTLRSILTTQTTKYLRYKLGRFHPPVDWNPVEADDLPIWLSTFVAFAQSYSIIVIIVVVMRIPIFCFVLFCFYSTFMQSSSFLPAVCTSRRFGLAQKALNLMEADDELLSRCDPMTIASALKQYLNSLPEPLITFTLAERWADSLKTWVISFLSMVSCLPQDRIHSGGNIHFEDDALRVPSLTPPNGLIS